MIGFYLFVVYMNIFYFFLTACSLGHLEEGFQNHIHVSIHRNDSIYVVNLKEN